MLRPDRLDPDKIGENLKTKRLGGKILVYDRTSSTNDIAAEYAKNGDSDGLVIFAEDQAAGRGRAGAKWHSSYGQSLLFSLVIKSNNLNGELLSLTCAVAVAESLGRVGADRARIKWPNDIILNGKKVAGILVESKRNHAGSTFIIGIGINCHQKKDSFPAELQTTATSIDIEGGRLCDRVTLARRLLASLDHWLELAERDKKRITDLWRELSVQLGHRIDLLYAGKAFVGNCIGIDPEKGLIVQLDTGGVRMFDAAHTTIAKNTAAAAICEP